VELIRNTYDVYLKCINGKFALPVTFALAKIRRRPFVLWTGVWTRLGGLHRIIFPLTRFVYRRADAIVVYGAHVRLYLEEEGVDVQKVFVAPHAVDNTSYSRNISANEREERRRQLVIPESARVLLYLGRLEPIKGLEYLVEAFARLRREDVVLVLAGEGTEKSRLQELRKPSNTMQWHGCVFFPRCRCPRVKNCGA
jgi:glycosyltransferase involved in cell wall biosynthesis